MCCVLTNGEFIVEEEEPTGARARSTRIRSGFARGLQQRQLSSYGFLLHVALEEEGNLACTTDILARTDNEQVG